MSGRHRTEVQLNTGCQRPYFPRLLIAAVASMAFSQTAASQQSPASDAPSGTEMTPRGEREVKDVNYGDWRKLCFQPGGAKMVCRTSVTGTFATGQMAIRLDIIEREGDGAKRLQVFSPVGMYLQNPVKLTIDQGKPYLVPYTWCLTNTCIAGTVVNPRLIQEMNTGRVLRLEFVDSNLLSLTTSLPLGQFALVHKNAPAQKFEQDIEE
ncbi:MULTISPECIES: invasion associated locus B family protein [unclassified Bradyrhizobium]|uniref:invasion associated locus B family protein n=1 Tax=unclassified Bradyrhizobium TaxID=2631580 RepID=UPI001FEEF4F5|nr:MULTISPECIES: invasion associated locus B family protein [unclassified Bradyrhizobium]